MPPEALRRVLDALPRPTSDLPAIVHRFGSGSIDISFERADVARWTLRSGDRVVNEGHRAGDVVHLPDSLPLGVYRLDLLGEDGRVCASRPLLVVPPTAFQGEFDRVWVLAVQLYSLRSERNWGIGDFTDLKNLIGMASTLGCAGIGLNPLHALFDDTPENCSPYAPNSRLFLNPVYIDVEAVEEFAGTDTATRDAIAREKQQPLIDYAAVARWKLAALRLAFATFKADQGGERFKQFDAFRQERGLLLQRFAAFEVLRGHFARPWWEWPEDCQRSGADSGIHAVADGDEVEFVEYLQWIAHVQLQDCTSLAKAMQLKIGLYLDVAVGVRADGFDAWLEQGAVSRELSVGAPPDLLEYGGAGLGPFGFQRRRVSWPANSNRFGR